MTVSRLAIFVAILMSYPIVFMGFRDGMVDSLGLQDRSDRNLDRVTIALILILTLVAMVVTDLGLINAVGGGTLGTALVFVFPAFMFERAVLDKPGKRTWEVYAVLSLMVVGVVGGLVGVWVAVVGA